MVAITLRADLTRGLTNEEIDANMTNLKAAAEAAALTASWAGITGKPATLAGYGITDAQPLLSFTPANKAGDTFTGNVVISNGTDSRVNLQVNGVTEGILTASSTNVRLSSANAIPITIGTNGVTRLTLTGTGFITTGASEYLGVGAQAGTNQALRVARNLENGTSAYGVTSDGTFQAGVTSTGAQYRSVARTAASAFTMASLLHYQAVQATLGAGSAITTQAGFVADSSLVGATNNYGFQGSIAAATGRWNVYMDGTAQNYFAGNVGIGSGKTVPATALDVNGTVTATSFAGSASGLTGLKTVNGNSILGSGNIQIDGGVTSFNTRTGAVTLSSGDVTTALGFTPLSTAGGTLTGTLTGTTVNAILESSNARIKFKAADADGGTFALLGLDWGGAVGTYKDFEVYDYVNGRTMFRLFGATRNAEIYGALSINGNTALHAGNVSSYALPLGGGTLTGALTGTSFSDGYITWSAAQINRPGSNVELQWAGTAGSTVFIGANGPKPIRFYADTGNALFSGSVRLGGGTSNPASTGFSHTLAGIGTNRVVNFDGNGNGTPSVWWTSGSRAYGAIDATDPGLTFWANNGSSWQKQITMNYGFVNVDTVLQQGGNQVLHASNYSNYALPITGGTLTGDLSLGSSNTYFGGSTYLRSNSAFSFLTNSGSAQNGRFNGIQVSDSYAGSVPTNGILFGTDTTLVRDGAYQLALSGSRVLHAGNYTSYSPSLTGSGASGTWGISVTGSSGSTSLVSSPDGDRVAGNKLPTSNARSVRFDFATAGSVGAAGNYAGVMTYAPWDGTTGSTGDSSYQLAFTNQSGVNASGPAQLLLRNGINSTWNSWQTILSSSNFSSYALPLSGGVLSGAVRGTQLTVGGSTNTDANLGVQGTSHLTGTVYWGGTVGNINSWSSLSTSSAGTHTFSGSRFIFDRYGYGSQALIDLQLGSIVLSQPTSITANLGVLRKRLTFSSTSGDANHSIYNNYDNIDGEGSWDGMKMNVYNGLRIRTGNGSGAVPTQIFGLDSSGIRIDGGVRQGNNLARPLAEWSTGGNSTGMVYIEMPGSSPGNYGMVHAVIDVYEYNSNAAATIVVGGHNWSGSWYNVSCNVIGATNKQVRLAVRNGKFVICLGDASSVWEYGTVMLRKIHNASFYNNIMDMGAQFVIAQTNSEGLSGSSGDLRALRTPASFNANGAITQAGNQVLHAGNFSSYALPQSGGIMTGTLNMGGNAITSVGTINSGTPITNVNYSSYGITRTSGSPAYYGARAYVSFNGTGTVTILTSQNVSSITDNGVGDYTVNFTTAMPGSNYAVAGSARCDNSAHQNIALTVKHLVDPTASSVRVSTGASGGSGSYSNQQDSPRTSVVIFF